MEKFIERRRVALAGLSTSPARVMDRRVHAYVRRRLHTPHSLDGIAYALFGMLQKLPAGAAPSSRRSLSVLANRALRQILAREATAQIPPCTQRPFLHLSRALAELPRVHAAVLIGRKRGMDDVTLARVTNIPRPLLDTYYSQAYVMIRCKAWNA